MKSIDTKKFNIHFISLRKNKERSKNILDIIKKHNLKATIFPAINGLKINYENSIKDGYITTLTKENMKAGAIGCGLSHITLLEQFLKSKKEVITVFEDDVFFHSDFVKRYSDFFDNVPKDFDVCQILHHLWNRDEKVKSEYKMDSKYVMKGYPQLGAVGLLVSRNGAKKLLSLWKPLVGTIDGILLKAVKNGFIKSYAPVKDIIRMPYSFRSTIWSTTSKIRNRQITVIILLVCFCLLIWVFSKK
jgi:GR25 family glycosyltransferase involved in LPS biosynthesis